MKKAAMSTSLLVVLVAWAQSPLPVSEVRRGTALFRSSVVPNEELTVARLMKIARDLIASGNGRGLSNLEFFSDPRVRASNCKYRNEVNYGIWRSDYDEALNGLGPQGEITTVNGSGVVRFRAADGSIFRRVIGERDPLIFDNGICSAELLRISPLPGSARGDEAELEFYARSTSASRACAETLAGELASRFGSYRFRLHVREDTWFLEEPAFPVIFPFADVGRLPSEPDYDASRQSGCDASSAGIHCWDRNSVRR